LSCFGRFKSSFFDINSKRFLLNCTYSATCPITFAIAEVDSLAHFNPKYFDRVMGFIASELVSTRSREAIDEKE
jgi:hypothetical protein